MAIIDGEIKAIKSGVRAAKDRLDQTEAPAALLDEASVVIDHYEAAEVTGKSEPEFTTKAGRRISAANQELLRKAMDHHESATKCIKDVLDSNAADDDPDNKNDNDPDDMTVQEPKALTEAEKRAKRIAEAKALRESAKV